MAEKGNAVAVQLVIPWWGWLGVVSVLVGIGIWVGSIQTNQRSFKSFMDEIRADIKKLLERSSPPPPVHASSPVSLTESGEKISSGLSVRGWAADEAPRLVEEARGKQEFEIFELCVSHVTARLKVDEDLLKVVRAGAYEYGTEPEQIRKVYEVELRDEVLKLIGKTA